MSVLNTARDAVAAGLFFTVVVLVIAAVWLPDYPAWITGVIAWIACLLLLPKLPRHQLRLVLILAGLGVAGIDGIAFRFEQPQDAVLFKLRWA